MKITKCDICNREISEKTIRVGRDFWVDYIEICEDCGAPVAEFLEKHKLLKKTPKKS